MCQLINVGEFNFAYRRFSVAHNGITLQCDKIADSHCGLLGLLSLCGESLIRFVEGVRLALCSRIFVSLCGVIKVR